jgi:hypothetical protein
MMQEQQRQIKSEWQKTLLALPHMHKQNYIYY